MTFWTTLTTTGVQYAATPSERRSIFLSNAVSVTLAGIGLALSVIYYFWYGFNVVTVAISLISLLSLSALILNHWNLSVISRIWICLFLPLTTIALSIYSKRV